MTVPLAFVRHQLPLLATMGRGAAAAVRQRVRPIREMPPLPGPLLSDRVPPRDPALVEAFLAYLGSRPGTWEGMLPPHFFPQFAGPLMARPLARLPYSPLAMLNGGCHLIVNRPMPMGEAIDVEAQLTDVEDEGRLAIITERVAIGTATAPAALDVTQLAVVPKKRDRSDGKAKKEKPTVPAGAQEIARWSIGARAGLEFALLTGDFNPIHWIPPAARAAGFKSIIAHGFSVMARAIEALVEGDGARLGELEVRFRKPLVLPAEVGAFIDGDEIWVAERVGAEPYMSGRFGLR